jgi:hypothetical protein
MKTPPKDFDLSTSRIPGSFYVPPKARDPIEIARRHTLAPGELVLEQQQRGVRIARLVLESLTDKQSVDFALPLLGVGSLNTAWHTHAQPERTQETGVRRRRLKYPWLPDWSDRDHLLLGVKHSLTTAETLAARVTLAHSLDLPKLPRLQRDFATSIGEGALAGACIVALGDGPIPGSPLRAQLFAREAGILLAESRLAVAEQVGSAPTLAQLADADSDLAVFWRRNAPDQAFAAYSQALVA